jgi:adenylate cyclase class 2
MKNRESEIKLPFASYDEALKAVHRLNNVVIKKKRHFEDNLVLDTPAQNLRSQGALLRVRIAEGKGILTYKGKLQIVQKVKDREEIESEFSEPENLIRILEYLGYKTVFRYQKYRTIYHVPNESIEICIDETPIGHYLELEGDIDKIHDYASRLGFSTDNFITDSYASLYYKWCRENHVEPSNMTFA